MYIQAFLALASFANNITSKSAPASAVNIFPAPTSLKLGSGEFVFHRGETVDADDSCAREARFLSDLIAPSREAADEYATDGPRIKFIVDEGLKDLGTEGYSLKVSPESLVLKAAKPAGIFYGIQTIRQLLPPAVESFQSARRTRFAIPSVEITDKPRFPWRGMLLDVSRHFFPKEDVEHFLDLLAMHKMNTFHWHLVDDGGWRIEIKKYPKLTDVGAWRTWTPAVWDYQNLEFPGTDSRKRVYGGFYTQHDIREIVRYAAERHITVVPEIEMPGHSMAAMSSYPELKCNDASVAGFKAQTGMPFPNVYCAGKEKSFEFIENVLDEVIDLFPSEFIHIGGDEVDKYLWQHCSDCKARMAEEHLKTPEELQSYFIRRIDKYLTSKGKRLIGWDEILEGGLAPNAAVMSWRGIDGGVAAARAGHDVVMTPTARCYFDYSYNDIPTKHVLGFEPIPDTLTPEQAKHILGGQCNLWTEWVPDRTTAEQRLFPRLVAMSQVLWSQKQENPEAFMNRLEPYYARLDTLGLNFYLPKPEADFDTVFLHGVSRVEFKRPALSNSFIRYTLDGSLPTASSQVYRGPIPVSTAMTVTAALFRSGGQSSEPVKVEVAKLRKVEAEPKTHGLQWHLYDGEFSKMPDFDRLSPISSGTSEVINLITGHEENYALSYDGYLKIDKEGAYKLSLSSDDGSVLWLNGVRVVDNDGLHGGVTKTGRVWLTPGLYAMRIGFFQAGGAQSLQASIEGPGMSAQPIPLSMLWR